MQAVAVEVTRGGMLESRHEVDVAVSDDAGAMTLSCGDVETKRFPRSAIKAFLALPLAEADPDGLDDASLVLASASHAGEARHVALARTMLERAGQDDTALACGAHWPLSREAADALVRAGRMPCALHNNCSGKHAGLICLAVAMGHAPRGYEDPAHPAMREAIAALAAMTATACDDANRAIDGCSIPTHAIPLARLAHGFARFGTGRGSGPVRQAASARLRRAVARRPDLLSGPGRFDTRMTERHGEAVFIKGGAEGVWCAAVPAAGIGIAIKARDGSGRAAQSAIAALVARFAEGEQARPEVLRNWNGIEVGEIRVLLPA